MANRFLISGVQLGMFIAMNKQKERQKLADKIQKLNWVGEVDHPIDRDIRLVKAVLERRGKEEKKKIKAIKRYCKKLIKKGNEIADKHLKKGG